MNTHVILRRCPQCNHDKALSNFIGKRKDFVNWCSECRGKYKCGDYGERASIPRRALRLTAPEPNLIWSARSGNKKLGGIPASIVSAETCPPSCGFYGRGCYAEFGPSGAHWRRAQDGISWGDFLTRVKALPKGQLWRYAVAGDLPGVGEELDRARLGQLVEANAGKRGFGFSHKRLDGHGDLDSVRDANNSGFTINLSADNLDHADQRASLGVAPVVVVVPEDTPQRGLRTPGGIPVAVCPAQVSNATCASCQLCARPRRAGIIAFMAHGQMRKTVSGIVG